MREPGRQRTNRRDSRRLPPRHTTKASCRAAGSVVPDLLLSIIDLSQTGARIILKGEITEEMELELTFTNPLLQQPLTIAGIVMWSRPLTDDRYCVGVQFKAPVFPADLEALTHRYGGAPWLFATAPKATGATVVAKPGD
jgi:hypothetical protein